MIASHANFQRYNPMRPVDWRWRRALWLVENGHNFCRHSDEVVTGQAVMFLRSLDPGASRRRVRRLRRLIPDILLAHELHSYDAVRASMVQARILAGQSSSEISRRLSLSAAVIDCYQKLFFDVSERLQARSYIQLQAVGLPVSSDSREQRIAKAVRSLAFNGGPVVYELAESVLFGVSGDSLKTESLGVNDQLAARMRLLIELLALPFDGKSSKILQLMADLTNTTRMDGAACKSPFTFSCEQFLTESLESLHQNMNNDDANALAEREISADVVGVTVANAEAA